MGIVEIKVRMGEETEVESSGCSIMDLLRCGGTILKIAGIEAVKEGADAGAVVEAIREISHKASMEMLMEVRDETR